MFPVSVTYSVCFGNVTLITIQPDIRELTNRRLSHDDAVGLHDMPTAHAFVGSCRRRAKVDDVVLSKFTASPKTEEREVSFRSFLSILLGILPDNSRITSGICS